jgi:hypothetical protein
MENKNITITKIHNELSFIPENKLEEVKSYIDSLLARTEKEKLKPVMLEGIWKGLGFEKIEDLDKSIQSVRKEISDSISKKLI